MTSSKGRTYLKTVIFKQFETRSDVRSKKIHGFVTFTPSLLCHREAFFFMTLSFSPQIIKTRCFYILHVDTGMALEMMNVSWKSGGIAL